MAQKEENKLDTIITLVDEVKTGIKNIKMPQAPQIDFTKIDNLTDKLEQATDTITDCMEEVGKLTEQVQQPLKTEHRHTFDIRSSYAFVALVLLGLTTACLAYTLITERQEADTFRDNDLKYRYIKMKGEALPQRLSELEELFEINRDNPKIKQLRKDVEEYERAVKGKAALDEQTRLRQLEAEKLKIEAESIRKK